MQTAETKITPIHIYYLNERSVTVAFGSEISEDLLLNVNAYNDEVNACPFQGFITTIPAYTTLTVVYDPLAVFNTPLPGNNCFEKVSNYLSGLVPVANRSIKQNTDTVTIPVHYGGVFGLDLEDLARFHKLSVEEVISLHSQATYTVYMIGFVPGFAYLGGMNEVLATPRKATPRKAVPADSVGIAGQQTGIYPMQTPGGWQIIGQTPLKMFDANRDRPSLLKAGDQVKFKPIGLDEFNHLKAGI